MVRAIRFWCKAAKVLADGPNPYRPRLPLTLPSLNGLALLGDQGLDPYLELPGSLWVLHWWMLAQTCHVPVWWLAFNRFGPLEFSDEELFDFVLDELHSVSWALPVKESLSKDVACLLRMYAPRVEGRFALDDLLDCPFRELGLVEQVWDDGHRFRFVLGPKPTLPPAIVTFACLDYLARSGNLARTSTVSRLAQARGGPGRVFKLTEEGLLAALQEHAEATGGIRITSAAGVPQLLVDGEAREESRRALLSYYRRADDPASIRLGDGPSVATAELFADTVAATP
jgi:hypothetical protein